MTDIRQLVQELLAQLGSSREAQQYLKEYSGTNQARFAVVKVGGGILRDHLDELTSALAFLHRLGLIPVVLHGAGPQLDQALADAGIETERREGLRVTSDAVMSVARPLMYRRLPCLLMCKKCCGTLPVSAVWMTRLKVMSKTKAPLWRSTNTSGWPPY